MSHIDRSFNAYSLRFFAFNDSSMYTIERYGLYDILGDTICIQSKYFFSINKYKKSCKTSIC